jgi:phage gpG-like protein
MPSETIELNDARLKDLLKAFKNKLPTVRVGILGDKNSRKDGDGQTNAEIGAQHEFGTTELPQRSFLRMPLKDHLQGYLDKSGLFDQDLLTQVVKDHSLVPWLKKIGVLGERVVAEAFDTGGFGKWTASNMANKANHQTLVETHQLRDSITSEVK